jgi:hypothetical protein
VWPGRPIPSTLTRPAGHRRDGVRINSQAARIVLTSNDPEFSQKVQRIRSILADLKGDEAFFSIDEFGSFAVKAQPGRMLVGPGEQRFVQQWQQSNGSIIVTAAIELSSNQITHFYSLKKNTDEMIRMMAVLAGEYSDRTKLYLSWDAASWHVSKKLFDRIDAHNVAIGSSGPQIETAPLPARAQFLNVIESIFSGMARAIIHNSNYVSVVSPPGAASAKPPFPRPIAPPPASRRGRTVRCGSPPIWSWRIRRKSTRV